MATTQTALATNNYVLVRDSKTNAQHLYQFDATAAQPFTQIDHEADSNIHSRSHLAQMGGYLLQWQATGSATDEPAYSYSLMSLQPTKSSSPMVGATIHSGTWPKHKFWGYRSKYSENPNEYLDLKLIPMGSFLLSLIPAKGRGTYELWNFDPYFDASLPFDPLPESYTDQGGFALIQAGHTLLPIGNYVLDRLPDGKSFRLWSFDPAQYPPLALPAVQEGLWHDIDASHELIVADDYLLDVQLDKGLYRVWRFDPTNTNVLSEVVSQGDLPKGINASSLLTFIQAPVAPPAARVETVGSMDYMRQNIQHVVYYMLESRSFDNVCGWLYDKDPNKCRFVGGDQAFAGASTEHFNLNDNGDKVFVSQFNNGKLSHKKDWHLEALDEDPFHDTTDNLIQMFTDPGDYWQRQTPNMGGFVLNTSDPGVMQTYSAVQMPVLNGLAKQFAVSDQWFCSMPGGTDVNRAFSVSGSAFNKLGTWEGGNPYKYWPYAPHRQSIWKLLWSHGIQDWKIYTAGLWEECIFTYQLYLEGQIPSVDSAVAETVEWLAVKPKDQPLDYNTDYLASMSQFLADAKAGNLPKFSYLEPIWCGADTSTSYHPGGDIIPGEIALNEIYNALRQSPAWDNTLLVVTFDKNNGIYDHVAPPYANKPWPHDMNNGFGYDLMGPRVPAIFASPWIEANTVIRSGQDTPFDSTSFAATLLEWFGIPKTLWALGDRIAAAPTFEQVFQATKARQESPTFRPAHDGTFSE